MSLLIIKKYKTILKTILSIIYILLKSFVNITMKIRQFLMFPYDKSFKILKITLTNVLLCHKTHKSN